MQTKLRHGGRTIRLVAALVVVSSLTRTAAQQPGPVVQFEIASVKINTTSDTNSYFVIPSSGRVSITNGLLTHIISQAFQVNPQSARFVLVGGSERIMATRFDINAKPPDDAPPGQAPAMLRTLLVQRFSLRTHTETRDVPVYALKVANGGRFGPKFRPSQHNCDEWVKRVREANSFVLGNGVAEPSDADGKSWCRSNPFDKDGLSARGAGTIAQLIRSVQAFADRPLVDMTSLAGNFEWDVKFVRASVSGKETPDSNVSEMFTAFREQLGLTLAPQLAPYELLVIDRVQMPTPD